MRNSQLFYVQVVNRKNCSSAHVQRNRMVLGLSSEEIESRFIQVFFSHKASWLFQCDCLTDINHVNCRLHYNYMSIAKIGQQSNSIEFLKVRTRDLNTACVFAFWHPHELLLYAVTASWFSLVHKALAANLTQTITSWEKFSCTQLQQRQLIKMLSSLKTPTEFINE